LARFQTTIDGPSSLLLWDARRQTNFTTIIILFLLQRLTSVILKAHTARCTTGPKVAAAKDVPRARPENCVGPISDDQRPRSQYIRHRRRSQYYIILYFLLYTYNRPYNKIVHAIRPYAPVGCRVYKIIYIYITITRSFVARQRCTCRMNY